MLLIALAFQNTLLLPERIVTFRDEMSHLRITLKISVTLTVGFCALGYWLESRIRVRKRRIEKGFPNALDVFQISAAAGLGFDAAMQRVGRKFVAV